MLLEKKISMATENKRQHDQFKLLSTTYCQLIELYSLQQSTQAEQVATTIKESVNHNTQYTLRYGTPAYLHQTLTFVSIANYHFRQKTEIHQGLASIKLGYASLLAAKLLIVDSREMIDLASKQKGLDYLIEHKLGSRYGAKNIDDMLRLFHKNYESILSSDTVQQYCTNEANKMVSNFRNKPTV